MKLLRWGLLGVGALLVAWRMFLVAVSDSGFVDDATGWGLFMFVLAGLLVPLAYVGWAVRDDLAAVAGLAALVVFAALTVTPWSYALAHIDDGLELLWFPFILTGEGVIAALAAVVSLLRRQAHGPATPRQIPPA